MRFVTLLLLIGCFSIATATKSTLTKMAEDVRWRWKHTAEEPIISDEHTLKLSNKWIASSEHAYIWKGRFDGITVAVKLFVDDKNMDHIKEVFEALNATNNPDVENYGIPTLYYAGKIYQRYPILVTTLFDESLFHRWKTQNKHFNMYSTLQVMLQSVKALQYMHEKEVVHNFIEPYNIFLRDDKVFIDDFEFATLKGEHHEIGSTTFASTGWWDKKKRTAIDDLESLLFTMWFIENIQSHKPEGSLMFKMSEMERRNFLSVKCHHYKKRKLPAYKPFAYICKDEMLSDKSSPAYEEIINRLEAAIIETGQTTFEWLSSPESEPSSSSATSATSATSSKSKSKSKFKSLSSIVSFGSNKQTSK